jgi:histidinol-phosphate aminotransferase
LRDYPSNLMPYLRDLLPDEAGTDPRDVSELCGIPPEKVIILSRNENSCPPSPTVLQALESCEISRYPDAAKFVEGLSHYTGFAEENIVIGAGMDEVITTVARLFLGPGDRALIPVPTYTFYEVAVKMCGADPLTLERSEGFAIDFEIPKGLKLIFLCSPNNPTGNTIPEKTVRAIAESTEGIVFLDEAYAEFAGRSLIKLVDEYQNLIVGRTFSKAFGLAGLRLGYAVAPLWMAEQYRRIAPLFSISAPSLAAGVAALGDTEHMSKSVKRIVSERERMRRRLPGACPSEGNFLFLHTRNRSGLVTERLLQKGIIIRDCSSFKGAGDHCIRVTVGTRAENDRFLEAFVEADG